uniref:CAZy families GH26 protein n=1 Tax=uncultured Spirosoma sp. TaxID=278208 RepID=A0A060CDR3_9BACT|nr:CAZy families GH26 protein [uncultured Spirosoma sp.]
MKINIITIPLFMALSIANLSAQKTADIKATAETKALYRNLIALQGGKVMLGHQDDTAYGIAWKGDENQSR